MSDTINQNPRRPKKRRTSVSIGGTSQSAFAGYSPQKPNSHRKPKAKPPPAGDEPQGG